MNVSGNLLTWSDTMRVASSPVTMTYQAEAQESAGGQTLTDMVESLTDNFGDATAVTGVDVDVLDTSIFIDGFESGDTSAWSNSSGL